MFPFSASREAKRCRLDIVHSHAITMMGFGSVKAARDLNVPLVGTFHTMLPLAATSYYKKYRLASTLARNVMWQGVKVFYGYFDLVTAPTKTVAKILEEKGVHNVVVVPNGVDTRKYHPGIDREPVRKMMGLARGEKLLVCAGRVSYEKNIDVLVRACRILRARNEKFRMVITGDGPAAGTLRQQISALGLGDAVTLIGFCPSYELPYYYAAADAIVTASTFETQGLAMLEAMACGAPVVGADSLAIPEAVKDGYNGYLFEPGNSADCAEKICKLINAPKARLAALSRHASDFAMSMSMEDSTDRLLNAYSEVL